MGRIHANDEFGGGLVLPKGLNDLYAAVFREHLLEVIPAGFVHAVKGIEVNGDDFTRIFAEEDVHGGLELGVINLLRQVFHHAVLMRDVEGVQEIDEHAVVFLEEPATEQGASGEFHIRLGKRADHGGVALELRLLLEEDGAELAGIRHGFQRGFVEFLVVFKGGLQDVVGKFRRHEAKKFVRRQHTYSKVQIQKQGQKSRDAGQNGYEKMRGNRRQLRIEGWLAR